MKRAKAVLALLSLWTLLMSLVSGGSSAQAIFNNQLIMPNGISTNAAGDVNIHSNGIATTLLTRFAADGQELIQISLGNGSIDAERFENSRLVTDPDALVDRLYLLSPEGDVVVFFASTLQEVGRFNIQDLTVDTTDVYDVAIEDTSNMLVLDPLTTTYGDIAAFRPNDGLNPPAWFVSGLASGTPFVMRIPMQDILEDVTEATVLLMSTEISPTIPGRAPGVAVSPEGIGMTTLPVPISISACPDTVIRFSATASFLSEDDVSELEGSSGVPSWGIDADSKGFYLVTGGAGNTACLGGGGGRLVVISSALTGIDQVIELASFPAGQPGDVAISSSITSPVDLIYITIPNFNTVVVVPAPELALP